MHVREDREMCALPSDTTDRLKGIEKVFFCANKLHNTNSNLYKFVLIVREWIAGISRENVLALGENVTMFVCVELV